MKLTPIVPKKPLAKTPTIKGKASAALRTWGGNVHRDAANYPPQRWTNYRRLGTLGRNWRAQPLAVHGALGYEVVNETPYGPYVQGPRQTMVMAGKGWKNVRFIAAKHQPALQEALKEALRG